MKKLNYILVLVILSVCSVITSAQAPRRAGNTAAITKIVQSYTDRHSQNVGKVRIVSSDVQGNWALVWADPVRKHLDSAQYLLHKDQRGWKVLVMGTALTGTGEEYKVPAKLRRKWNL